MIRKAAAPLLRDLAANGMSLPDIRDEATKTGEPERSAPGSRDQAGPEGISVPLDCSPPEQVVRLAEQFQNWASDR